MAQSAQSENLHNLVVGGFVSLTTIDYPGHLSAVIFAQGCVWRCPFCYNRHLHPFTKEAAEKWQDIITFLKKRAGILEAVVFSGGEPLAQREHTLAAMQEVKNLGYKIALHTSGVVPDILEEALKLVDWVGLDFKAPPEKYDQATGIKNSWPVFEKSFNTLIKSNVPFEIRTTCDPRILEKKDVLAIAEILNKNKLNNYALQEFLTVGQNLSEEEINNLIPLKKAFFNDTDFEAKLKKLIPNLTIRKKD